MFGVSGQLNRATGAEATEGEVVFDEARDPSDTGIGPDTPQGGEEDEPLHGQGGEGRAKEEATPPIADDAEPGQTQHKEPSDDVGGQRGGEARPGA